MQNIYYNKSILRIVFVSMYSVDVYDKKNNISFFISDPLSVHPALRLMSWPKADKRSEIKNAKL